MKIILATLLTTTLFLAGCAGEDPYYKIKVASPNEVAGCKFVGNLTSSSQNYGLFEGTAKDHRIANAKQSGYNLGANRVVLAPSEENGNTTITEGKAYICPD